MKEDNVQNRSLVVVYQCGSSDSKLHNLYNMFEIKLGKYITIEFVCTEFVIKRIILVRIEFVFVSY
jgi:hypothetical protein